MKIMTITLKKADPTEKKTFHGKNAFSLDLSIIKLLKRVLKHFEEVFELNP